MSLVKNFSTRVWQIEEKNQTRELSNEKPFEYNKEIWKKN